VCVFVCVCVESLLIIPDYGASKTCPVQRRLKLL
jgi:hypothetical protein